MCTKISVFLHFQQTVTQPPVEKGVPVSRVLLTLPAHAPKGHSNRSAQLKVSLPYEMQRASSVISNIR